jgi:hypothetical protein
MQHLGIERTVARATGESLRTIRRLGFQLAPTLLLVQTANRAWRTRPPIMPTTDMMSTHQRHRPLT